MVKNDAELDVAARLREVTEIIDELCVIVDRLKRLPATGGAKDALILTVARLKRYRNDDLGTIWEKQGSLP